MQPEPAAAGSLIERGRARGKDGVGMEPQRGDIVVERLTGKRAIVIQVQGEEVTCRFGDGRLEDRYSFELERSVPFTGWLASFVSASSWVRPSEHVPAIGDRKRPMLVRGA
jgi:hypothetical protein